MILIIRRVGKTIADACPWLNNRDLDRDRAGTDELNSGAGARESATNDGNTRDYGIWTHQELPSTKKRLRELNRLFRETRLRNSMLVLMISPTHLGFG